MRISWCQDQCHPPQAHEAARQLSLDDFCALVDPLPPLRRAVMQGIGEPLLNRDLAPMIRHLKGRGVYVVFKYQRRSFDSAPPGRALIESGLDERRVSLDGSTPETYLKVRGIPGFERVVDNATEMVHAACARSQHSAPVVLGDGHA